MKVLANGLRVVGKNERHGNNDRGDWDMYELECGNGEGSTVILQADMEVFNSIEPFVPVTAEIDIYRKGYNIGGTLVKFWED